MEADEIQGSAGFAAGIVLASRAVLEKLIQKLRGLWTTWAGCIWTADARLRQRAQNCLRREVVEFEKFLRSSLPVIDVGFVPYLPQPGPHLCIAVTLTQVTNKLKN